MSLFEKQHDDSRAIGASRPTLGAGSDHVATAVAEGSDAIQGSARLIRMLASVEPRESHDLPLPDWPSKWERWSTYPLSAAAPAFLFLCVAAGFHWHHPLSTSWVTPTIWIGLLAYVLSAMSIVMNLVASLGTTFVLRGQQPGIRERRAGRDLRIAQKVARYSKAELDLADSWLEQDVRRIESRLVLVFGGLDRVALLSLLGFAWQAWKDVLGESFSQFGSPIWFGLCVLAGLGLAGIKMRILMRELAYHRDLIALARKLQTQEGNCPTMPLQAQASHM